MLGNKIVSGMLVTALAMGITACGGGVPTPVPDPVPDSVEQETGNKPGEETEKIYGGADVPEDTTEAQTEPQVTGDKASTGLITDKAGEDYIVFLYEYGNMAWGYQSYKFLFLNNGDVYYFKNDIGTASDQAGRDLAVKYLKEYSEPSFTLDIDGLRDLYEACKKIAPDVKTTSENTAKDMGSYEFKFLDPETSKEVLISKDGDWTMKTDDPALLKAQDKAAKILTKQFDTIKPRSLSLSTAIINVPYGGKDLIGKNMSFDSYDKFTEFCKKNGIDAESCMTDALKKSYRQAKYIIVQVYDTNRRISGYMTYDNKELKFLPSLEEYEHDPAFDGKVTVAIMRCDQLEKTDYVNEDGTPWK